MLAREILSPPETWRIIIIDKYVEMDLFQLMIAKNASIKKSVFAFLLHKLHSDRSIQSTQLLISNNSLFMYLSYIYHSVHDRDISNLYISINNVWG